LDGELVIGAAKEWPGLPGYQFGATDDEVTAEHQPLTDLPETDRDGKARFSVALEKLPATARLLEAKVVVRMSEPGGRAVERKLTRPGIRGSTMIGVKPLFSGQSLGEGDTASFDVVVVNPDGKTQERKGLRYELLKIEKRYQWYRQEGRWEYEPVK